MHRRRIDLSSSEALLIFKQLTVPFASLSLDGAMQTLTSYTHICEHISNTHMYNWPKIIRNTLL